jgi:hypothetical protein
MGAADPLLQREESGLFGCAEVGKLHVSGGKVAQAGATIKGTYISAALSPPCTPTCT